MKSIKKFYVHESSYIDDEVEIGANTKIWHFSHLMSNAVIGKDCILGQNVVISPKVIIGDRVKIQNNVSVYTGVICEDDVFLGPSVVFTNVINPRSAIVRKEEFKTTILKKGASIGANATIVCGNIIGKYAFVGAGSVVTKDVLDYSLVVGNPARHVGWMSEYGENLIFTNDTAICKNTGHKYLLKQNKVIRI